MKPVVDAAERKRRKKSTLNRVINNVKACLNRAFQNGHVSSDAAWRRLRKFKGADGARTQWLTVDQCRRLINAAAPDFRPLVHAAMLTGARWGELRALKCRDYDPASGTINIAESKSGKPRRVYLTDDGKAAFESWTAGRGESEVIFKDRFGNPWGSHDQHRPMLAACEAARIEPAIGMHTLRHSYASSLVQAGVSLAIVAEALGHSDTRMVSKHYGHLAPSHIADAIRARICRHSESRSTARSPGSGRERFPGEQRCSVSARWTPGVRDRYREEDPALPAKCGRWLSLSADRKAAGLR